MELTRSSSSAGPRTGFDGRLDTWPTSGLLGFGLSLLVLGLCFHRAILEWLRFAAGSELYSHVLLIPLVTLYLAWLRRDSIRQARPARSVAPAAGFLVAGLGALAPVWIRAQTGSGFAQQDWLFLMMVSLVSLFVASLAFFAGWPLVRRLAFPLGLLFFVAPFPRMVESGIESFFQQTSAVAAMVLFQVSGTAVLREGLILHLPGIVLDVSPECSGLRSSLVLFITSLVAGYLFLRSPWRRSLLAAFVIPLAIVRNGLRIYTLGMLSVYVDPNLINSWVHTKGGPLFFALSLVPFLVLLLWLWRAESKARASLESRDVIKTKQI